MCRDVLHVMNRECSLLTRRSAIKSNKFQVSTRSIENQAKRQIRSLSKETTRCSKRFTGFPRTSLVVPKLRVRRRAQIAPTNLPQRLLQTLPRSANLCVNLSLYLACISSLVIVISHRMFAGLTARSETEDMNSYQKN